jgi:hypothetical protein
MRARPLLIAACLSAAIVARPCAAHGTTAIRELLDHIRDETGAPGVSAAVAASGRTDAREERCPLLPRGGGGGQETVPDEEGAHGLHRP